MDRRFGIGRATLILQFGEYLAGVARPQQRAVIAPRGSLDQRVDIAIQPHRNSLPQNYSPRFGIDECAATRCDYTVGFAHEPCDHAPLAIAEIGLPMCFENLADGAIGRAFYLFVDIYEICAENGSESASDR